MKKILITMCSIIVVGVLWFGVKSYNSDAKVQAASVTPVVKTWKDEPSDGDSGNSLATAIFNANQFSNSVSQDDSWKRKSNFDTVIDYEEGAIKWAYKINASDEIKTDLKKALELSKQKHILKASKILSGLNSLYNKNNPYFKQEMKNAGQTGDSN